MKIKLNNYEIEISGIGLYILMIIIFIILFLCKLFALYELIGGS